MFVIGTAGHIDHGKSTLVHRLTGIDPDRLAEEKRRGMTLDLGFAWMVMPSGRAVSLVDVPGHERLVRHMVAGAGGVDVALLVVAADEGVMPQTREHLAVLELLGISQAVVALTRIDLVDDDLLALVREEIVGTLAATDFRASPIAAVSAVTGQNLDDLRLELDRALDRVPDPHTAGPAWLPIDRVFSAAGFGTVVTGTLHGHDLHVGSAVELVPGGATGRIRGLQIHRSSAKSAHPGSRVAVNIAGPAADQVRRGAVLAEPGGVPAVTRFGARVLAPAGTLGLQGGETRVALHVGAAEVPARVRLLDSPSLLPGEAAWAEVVIESPVPVVRGQRFVLRRPAPLGTVAGGEVVDVSDRWPRRREHRVARFERLWTRDVGDVLLGLLENGARRTVTDLALLSGFRSSVIEAAVEGLRSAGNVVCAGESVVAAPTWFDLSRRAVVIVDEYTREHPLRAGVPLEQLRRGLRMEPREFHALLDGLREDGMVEVRGGSAARPDSGTGPDDTDPAASRILDALRGNPFAPPSGGDLRVAAGAGEEMLSALARTGAIVRLNSDVALERSAFEEMVRFVRECLHDRGTVTVADVRDRFQTSRKYAVALLEHLDDLKFTRRNGDLRVAGRGFRA